MPAKNLLKIDPKEKPQKTQNVSFHKKAEIIKQIEEMPKMLFDEIWENF